MKEDRPVGPAIDVAPIQQSNEAPVLQPDDGNSNLNLGDGQFEGDAASIKAFGRARSRSNPEWAVEEEQIVAGATPVEVPARVRRKSDAEEWVANYNLAKVLGVTKDPTPTPVDTSLLPHSHILHHLPLSENSEGIDEILRQLAPPIFYSLGDTQDSMATPADTGLSPRVDIVHHVPPSQRLEGVEEFLHQRAQEIVDNIRILNNIRDLQSVEMAPYRRTSTTTKTRDVLLHTRTTWTLSLDRIKVKTEMDVYRNTDISADDSVVLYPLTCARAVASIPRNVRSDHPPISDHRPGFVPPTQNEQAPGRDLGRQLHRSSENTSYQEHHQMQRSQPRGQFFHSRAPELPRQTLNATSCNAPIYTQEAGRSVAPPSQLGNLTVEPVAESMAQGDSSSSHELPTADQSHIVSTLPTTHDASETSDNETTNITPKAKHHEPRTRKPASKIQPAVPDMHKINQLLMKQKQTEQSNIGVKNAQEAMTSGDYNEAENSNLISNDAEPSDATAVSKSQEGTVSQFDKPAVSAPKELSQPNLAARKSSNGRTSPVVNTRLPPLRTDLAVPKTDNSTYDPAKTALSTSNTFSPSQDFMNEDQAGSPSSDSKILTSRLPSPEHSTPPENSPTKQVADVDETFSRRVAEPDLPPHRETSEQSQGHGEIFQDNSPPTMDQRYEPPSDVIATNSLAQSSEHIPVMHDSADQAAQIAESGSVSAGDVLGQHVEQDVTRDDDSGTTGQPIEQDATRDITSYATRQPGEQGVTRDNASGMIRSASFDNAPDTNTLCPVAVASKAAKNKKKNLKRKEKKERDKREADQEVNPESGAIASSSTAYGTRAVSFRSERPSDFHAPVALQPGQARNQPAATSLSQMAHEYNDNFGNFSPSHMLSHEYEDHR